MRLSNLQHLRRRIDSRHAQRVGQSRRALSEYAAAAADVEVFELRGWVAGQVGSPASCYEFVTERVHEVEEPRRAVGIPP